jgi:hypothetical protein
MITLTHVPSRVHEADCTSRLLANMEYLDEPKLVSHVGKVWVCSGSRPAALCTR